MNIIQKQNIVEDPDTGAIVICALRYCVGRRTYMPSLVTDWVKRHWDILSESDKNVIKKDIEQIFTDSPRNLGDECDVRTWQDFREWIAKN